MLTLRKKVTGSSMIENIIAVCILTSSMLIAFMVILQSNKNDNLLIKSKSIINLQNQISTADLQQEFLNTTIEKGPYTIECIFENQEEMNIVLLTYEIILNETQVWQSGKIYFPKKN